MYTDLFSSMDGARSVIYWVVPMMSLFLVILGTLWGATLYFAMWSKIASIWKSGSTARFNSMYLMVVTLFGLFFWNNFMGLSPMNYTITSDLLLVSSMSLVLWMMLLASGYVKSPKSSLAHLAPSGAPLALLPFLVVIETISILIRPLTLTVRMVANISAGHIVLGLLANATTIFVHSTFLPMMILLSLGYNLFEFFVSIIQAYIFTLLITLYSTEHP
uniref:ATP synthase F0 subunit 6 n=1 Tax=Laeocathaica amdoana TaxID=2936362 RepID=UPI0022FDA149|nr:ATP synthase F0 subunit 6 [Laeocathaica amdoana]WBF92702.1 ATP synthase F0 subunit 6 [Laeocathaica amdoana]